MKIVKSGSEIQCQVNPNRMGWAIFTMTSNTGDEVVFENPTHDFPTMIRYWQENIDTLNAEVTGGGQSMTLSWARDQ